MAGDSFYDVVKDINGILRITIPSKFAEVKKIKKGTSVKVLVEVFK